jgi:pimeloyl-ACP methyl ester carboxylesterase
MIDEKFIDVNGIRTRYFEKGAGPIVVLFHGGHFGSHDAADCAEDWNLNFDGLAQWFHVYAVDKIGQGYTDNPKRDEDYTMATVVQHAYGFESAGFASRPSRSATRAALSGRVDAGTSGAVRFLHFSRHQHPRAGHQQERNGHG